MAAELTWKDPEIHLTEHTERTILNSECGEYRVTCSVYLDGGENAYSDRCIAEHRVDGRVQWFSRHRKEKAAIAAANKRFRAVKRGLPKRRQRRTRTDLVIKRKKT